MNMSTGALIAICFMAHSVDADPIRDTLKQLRPIGSLPDYTHEEKMAKKRALLDLADGTFERRIIARLMRAHPSTCEEHHALYEREQQGLRLLETWIRNSAYKLEQGLAYDGEPYDMHECEECEEEDVEENDDAEPEAEESSHGAQEGESEETAPSESN